MGQWERIGYTLTAPIFLGSSSLLVETAKGTTSVPDYLHFGFTLFAFSDPEPFSMLYKAPPVVAYLPITPLTSIIEAISAFYLFLPRLPSTIRGAPSGNFFPTSSQYQHNFYLISKY